MNLLCQLGIHKPEWHPEVGDPFMGVVWISLYRCVRCGRPISHGRTWQ